jgi:C-terminal processing protease CtpA/Prc
MDTATVVDHVSRLLDEHYVFPEIAARLRTVLSSQSAAGRYAGADAETLAKLVTEDLQSINGDKHLRLLYNAEGVDDENDEETHLVALRRQAEATAGGVARVERLKGNIGYLDLRPILFPTAVAAPAAIAAMNIVASTDALLIDLRQCLGGTPDMVALLCTYLLDTQPVHLNSWYVRDGDRTDQSWSLPYVPGARFGPTKPVYVLTSATTFSGAEELTYNLQQLKRATLVGENTRGGAHPRQGFKVDPHLLATIPVARSVHPVTGGNWEGTGIAPDVAVPAQDAYPAAYRMALRQVLDGGHSAVADEAREALAEL